MIIKDTFNAGFCFHLVYQWDPQGYRKRQLTGKLIKHNNLPITDGSFIEI